MKVVIAVHHFPPRYTGGAEWRAYRTASAMKARGHDVQVVCVEHIDSGPKGSLGWEDDDYDGLKVRRLSFDLSSSPDPFQWQYDNPWIRQHLHNWFSHDRPDVFHLIGGYLISVGALHSSQQLGIPTVVTMTDYWFLCPRISLLRSNGEVSTLPINPTRCARCLGEQKRRYRILGRLVPKIMDRFWALHNQQTEKISTRLLVLFHALLHVDVLISPSQFLRTVFIEAGVPPEKIIFSRQGRDRPPALSDSRSDREFGDICVGYLGQIARHKGVHVLCEAVRMIEDPRLRVEIYGDLTLFPKYVNELEKIRKGDERLRFMGSFERRKLSNVLRGLDVLVVPSIWYENSPNVILEAFAHQTPVVASNLGGMAELVRDGVDGFLFQPGNSTSLAGVLRRLIEDPNLISQLSAQILPVKSVAQEMDELERIYSAVGKRDSYPVGEVS